MQKIIEKTPVWLIAISLVGLFTLLAYSLYDDRAVKIGPFEIGPSITSMNSPNSGSYFDSDWFGIATCQRKDLTDELKQEKFSDFPALMMAYYRVYIDGKERIIPWGISQYGDGRQLNGVLIDFSENEKNGNLELYVRSPCKHVYKGSTYIPHVLDLGWYKDRINDTSPEEIIDLTEAEFRIQLWGGFQG